MRGILAMRQANAMERSCAKKRGPVYRVYLSVETPSISMTSACPPTKSRILLRLCENIEKQSLLMCCCPLLPCSLSGFAAGPANSSARRNT